MFNFFKKKLKSWIGKSKKEIEEKAEEEIEKAEKEIEEKKGKEKIKEKLEKEVKEKKKKAKIEEKLRKKEGLVEEQITREAPTFAQLEKEKKPTIFKKIKEKFTYKLTETDFEDIFENLEMLLLENNVALEATEAIKQQLKAELLGKEIEKDKLETEIRKALKKAIENLLMEPDDLLSLVKEKQPFVIVFFGVNGGGKTTSIAKIAHLFLKNNISCVLAASDTFRAGSEEQLQRWADRLGVKVVKHSYGADPAAVAFDAIKHAKAHNIQVVLIDTAGRMHTQSNLLNEMEKICRVTDPDLKIFVAESITGNDAVQQAKIFNEQVGIDAIILTKADVDERGGAAVSVSYVTGKPILYLGTGQQLTDLELFNIKKFIKQLGL